ncbi:UDP-N-acetylmuramoyl-L-alanine--D-glutamate ligase [Candidatus Uhrbacteria bacterium]|nr:UDP-N-acetylmuramoyl-L-alanine--D-glutamate ligase [Candidatus Uhrbacteria bacterium]
MKILILGLGQYPQGSGVSAALYFARRGEEVTVTDLKTAKELKENVGQLKKFKNVRFVLGKHDLKDIESTDLVVANPRVRRDSREMKLAIKRGIPIESDISLFLAQCPARVIGVTGTRGKSTTATLIAEMLKAGGAKVWLGGNILVSPLTFLSKVKKDDLVVLELSSWQLESLGEKGISPPVAVWTNLMRDHLNTYKSMEEYAEAKAQIFRHQKPSDIVFLPVDRSFDGYAREAASRVYRTGKKKNRESIICYSTKLKVVGEHNRKNAEMAVAVALRLGVKVSAIKSALRSFKGLPNRLELIATTKGIKYINDTTATTPDATIAAIKALSNNSLQLPLFKRGRVHLIFGGADKELEFVEVAKMLKRFFVNVALLPGTAHTKIVKAFRHDKFFYQDAPNLRTAIKTLQSQARVGDTILLSPGCASFGLFKNEFDRGEQFKKLIKG